MNPAHRNPSILIALSLACLVVPACRTNLLPEYMPKVQTAHVVTFIDAAPHVSVGGGQETGIVGDVASIGWAVEMQKRLAAALDAETLATALAATFEQSLQPSFGTTLITDAKDAHDAAIQIDISEFGVQAASIEDPAYYTIVADVRMVYRPENKLIWEYTTKIHEPLQPVHVSGSGLFGAVGAVINLSALDDLDDDQLRQVFAALASDAGATIVEQMRSDAVE